MYIERSKSFVTFVSYVRQHGKENVKYKKEGNQSTQTNIRVRYKCNKLQHMQVLLRLKYIYIFFTLGQNVQCPNADEIIYTLNEREYVEKIEKAYSYASKTLLDLLMDERALMARLR